MSYLKRSLNIGLDDKLPFVDVDKRFQMFYLKRSLNIGLDDKLPFVDVDKRFQ
ncbi:9152_t:CDS:2, partial [Acaulospora morrowiae]